MQRVLVLFFIVVTAIALAATLSPMLSRAFVSVDLIYACVFIGVVVVAFALLGFSYHRCSGIAPSARAYFDEPGEEQVRASDADDELFCWREFDAGFRDYVLNHGRQLRLYDQEKDV